MEEIEEDPSDDHVVIEGDQKRDDDHSPTDTCNMSKAYRLKSIKNFVSRCLTDNINFDRSNASKFSVVYKKFLLNEK